nr:HNH endonuclease [Nostoc sp. FACHB-892]
MVYEHTKSNFEAFINSVLSLDLLDEWSKEHLNDEWIQPKVQKWINNYFDHEADDIGKRLHSDITKIVRHIAQDNLHSKPPYYSFEEREIYDLDKIAHKLINYTPTELHNYVNQEFSKPKTLWETFYKTRNRLVTAIQLAINKIIIDGDSSVQSPTAPQSPPQTRRKNRELLEGEKEQVKRRDCYACLCCGANTKGKLQIDHIKPFSMGGETSVENSQTLCVICNKCKGNNEIDFRCKTTKLSTPKNLDLSFRTESQNALRTLTRVVNLFYHCKAVYKVEWDRSTFGYNIYLYPNNNCIWLLQHKVELLKYVQDKLGRQAYHIKVTTKE